MQDSTERHATRNTLLSNGYRPLPLADKGPRIRGWVADEIDQAWIDRFARSASYKGTGIRCDDLAAIDIDVLDETLADACEELVEKLCGTTDFCRVGRWPKRLLLYRIEGEPPQKSGRTGKYGGHMVELLCSRGRQFAAFGIHPGTGEPYQWLDDNSPLDTLWEELPAITADTAWEALDALDALLEATGLPKTTNARTSDIAPPNVYDLADSTRMEVDGLETTWGDLKADLTFDGLFANIWREEDDAFGDSGAIHCYISKGSNQPCAHDFARDCTHWEATVPPEFRDIPTPPPGGLFAGPLDRFLDEWVLLGDQTVRHVDEPLRVYTLAGFKQLYQHIQIPTPTRQNANKTTPVVTVWLQNAKTMRADHAELRPDETDLALVPKGNRTVFNLYNPPDHPTEGGEAETAFEFVEHLVPKKSDRDIFWDWNAAKLANPGWRMHGLMMVTPAFGTGRGTWAQILRKLFGPHYVVDIALSDLVGTGGQAAFNEFLATSLIVNVPEAFEEREDTSKWVTRHAAYEQLKQVCDPVAGPMHVKRKYGRNTIEMVYASLFISSNHTDALAIEPGDRRLVVIDNTETPLVEAGDLGERIQAWKDNPLNIGALYRELMGRWAFGISYDPFGTPPETDAKARMIEAAQSEVDRLFELWQSEAAGDICTDAQWRKFAHAARFSHGIDLPTDPDRLNAALRAVMQKRGRRLMEGNKQMRVTGKVVRPWVIRNFSAWKSGFSQDSARAEIAKNGDPGGNVVELPK